MKLIFLGTGAAGSMNTPESEMQEGKRRCTSLLIDDNVVVDVALQSFDYATKLGAKTNRITDIFLSHTHEDHYKKEALLAYAAAADTKINFWCHKGAVPQLQLTEEEAELIHVCPVEIMEKWETAGMTVTALPANHLVEANYEEQPLHFIFEKDGKTLFYGCDGGWFQARTWEYMRKNAVFDAMILEATVGECPGNFRIGTHNTFPMLRLLLAALAENNMLKENVTLISSHMSKLGYDGNADRVREEMGIIVAYDGMTIEI